MGLLVVVFTVRIYTKTVIIQSIHRLKMPNTVFILVTTPPPRNHSPSDYKIITIIYKTKKVLLTYMAEANKQRKELLLLRSSFYAPMLKLDNRPYMGIRGSNPLGCTKINQK